MDFRNAEGQFDENFQLFSNPRTEPEKYNLYAGLSNLAKGLQQLQSSISQINQRLQILEQKIR